MRKTKFKTPARPLILVTVSFLTLFYLGTSFLPASEKAVPPLQNITKPTKQTSPAKPLAAIPPKQALDSDPLEVASAEITPEAETLVQEYTFKRGDSLSKALSKIGVSTREIHEIAKVSKPVFDLRKIQAGQSLQVTLQQNPVRFASLQYEFGLTQTLKVARSGEKWFASKEETPLIREIARSVGTINSSLYVSAKAQGVPSEIILKLSDIFAWDVDFGLDIRRGDQFNVVYEVFKKDGRIIRSGRVLAAEIINRGHSYPAYYFNPQGKGNDYYDDEGRSLRKAFLKSPLRYRYISSGYSKRRIHPILKVNRPHLGIDFAAKRGTPVRAASDGTVIFAGWKGGNGKTVIIRHKNGYKTLYGHLSSFWKGIKKGKRVKQEDFIGRVGSTGLSTGPHLHYTLIKNGKAINPNKVTLLRGEALDPEWLSLFSKQLEEMNRILYPAVNPPQNPVAGSGTT